MRFGMRRGLTIHALVLAGTALLTAGAATPGALARPPASGQGPLRSPAIIDRTDRFPLTNLDMQVGNYGTFARTMTSPGVIYPRGSGHGAM